jgi:hypothetical protein
MAKTEPVKLAEEQKRYDKLFTEAVASSEELFKYTVHDFSTPDKGSIGDILRQRHRQRKWLFRYALIFSTLTFVCLAVMLYAQGVYKMHHGTDLFGKIELGTVGIGVFVQFLGLLKIITDSLWNDRPYLDSGALKKDGNE